MAALSKRDIEMIFRAETDAAQRPVNELSSDVKRLRQSLEDLAKTGDSDAKHIICEYVLEACNEASSGAVRDMS